MTVDAVRKERGKAEDERSLFPDLCIDVYCTYVTGSIHLVKSVMYVHLDKKHKYILLNLSMKVYIAESGMCYSNIKPTFVWSGGGEERTLRILLGCHWDHTAAVHYVCNAIGTRQFLF